MFRGFHRDRNIPISIEVDYDEELKQYIVTVQRGFDREVISFIPKHIPEEGSMHISDLEKSVKIANNTVKALRRMAIRRNE